MPSKGPSTTSKFHWSGQETHPYQFLSCLYTTRRSQGKGAPVSGCLCWPYISGCGSMPNFEGTEWIYVKNIKMVKGTHILHLHVYTYVDTSRYTYVTYICIHIIIICIKKKHDHHVLSLVNPIVEYIFITNWFLFTAKTLVQQKHLVFRISKVCSCSGSSSTSPTSHQRRVKGKQNHRNLEIANMPKKSNSWIVKSKKTISQATRLNMQELRRLIYSVSM